MVVTASCDKRSNDWFPATSGWLNRELITAWLNTARLLVAKAIPWTSTKVHSKLPNPPYAGLLGRTAAKCVRATVSWMVRVRALRLVRCTSASTSCTSAFFVDATKRARTRMMRISERPVIACRLFVVVVVASISQQSASCPPCSEVHDDGP